MSALAEALEQVQRRAVAALAKQYVGRQLDADAVRIALDSIGCTDPTDTERWLNALDLIRETGAELPRENGGGKQRQDEPATTAQRERIKRDVAKLHGEDAAAALASEPTLTKAQASEIISSIVAGTFELDRWAVPF